MCFRFVKVHQIRNLQHLHFWVHGSPSKILQNNERAPDPSLQHCCGSLWILNKWGRFCRDFIPSTGEEKTSFNQKNGNTLICLFPDWICGEINAASCFHVGAISLSPLALIWFHLKWRKWTTKKCIVHRAIISSLASKPRHVCAFSQNCRVRYICESSCSILPSTWLHTAHTLPPILMEVKNGSLQQ